MKADSLWGFRGKRIAASFDDVNDQLRVAPVLKLAAAHVKGSFTNRSKVHII